MANEFDLGFNIASIETELPDPVITLSGADVLTASDTAEMPLLNLTAYGKSTQEYASHGGEPLGKNLLQIIPEYSITYKGVTVTSKTDDNGLWCVEIKGTSASDYIDFFPFGGDAATKALNLPDGDYILNGIQPNSGVRLVALCENDENPKIDTGNGVKFTQGNNDYYYIRLDVFQTGDINTVIYPMIRLASIMDDTYEPYYSNPNPDCPVPIESIGDGGSLMVTTQDGTVINIADIGIEGYGIPVSSGGNYTDSNGQQWICDELVVNTDGTGNIIKRIRKTIVDGINIKGILMSYNETTGMTQWNYGVGLDFYVLPDTISGIGMCSHAIYSPHIDGTYTHFVPILDGGNKYMRCWFQIGKATTEELNTWLSDNPVTFIYQLDTPTEAELTSEQITALQPVIDKYGAFTAYFMSTQDGTPTPENPVEIVSTADLYKSTAAKITTALPLRGIPVKSSGNYIDSDGQEWVCDTLEHVYGEPAQVTKRIAASSVSAVALDTLGTKAVIQFDANYAGSPGASYRWYRYYCDYIVVYENPDAAYGVFYECHGVHYAESCDLEPYVKESSLLSGQWGRPEEFTFYGDIRVSDGLKDKVSVKSVVTLADGTTDPEIYICETGKLTVGAEVIYPQKAETALLTTKETDKLNGLSGFTGSTTVYNNSTAEMTVKLLREDFEMQYINWIKESQSFVCEKSGKYKIICVGGGSSGGIGASGAAEVLQAVGTTTSFGTIISAEGGGKSKTLISTMLVGEDALIGGQSGYDGINYGSTSHVMAYESAVHVSSAGGNSSVMWGTGHGYGAGGGARGYSDKLVAAGGRCGKVESTIVDLEKNQTIACTIGGGGVLKLSDANVLDYIKTYVDPEKTAATGEGEKVSACVSDGADGVIIIQYLGV